MTDCATATFDNCAECGDVNATTGVAECEDCANGYTLEDELETLSCKCRWSLLLNEEITHGHCTNINMKIMN